MLVFKMVQFIMWVGNVIVIDLVRYWQIYLVYILLGLLVFQFFQFFSILNKCQLAEFGF